jgi:hypothetical protein
MRIYGTAGTTIEQTISDVSINMLVIRTNATNYREPLCKGGG